MEQFFRLSTSPTNEWNGDPRDASHYCDLHLTENWRQHRILEAVAEPVRNEALTRGIVGYRVIATHGDRHEVGLLVRVNDESEGVMYLGIDLQGGASRAPAANEALWDAANIAERKKVDNR